LAAGTIRIVYAVPVEYMVAGFAVSLIVLALMAPRPLVPLALDSGGIATSVVTVPLITAFGIAVSEAVPHTTSPADGFGLVVLALLSPMVVLLAIALIQAWLAGGKTRR
jgi:hypothetical protein